MARKEFVCSLLVLSFVGLGFAEDINRASESTHRDIDTVF